MSKLVTVGTFTGPIEAHLAKGRLEVEGLPAFVVHEHHIWANWSYSQALGGIKVQVIAEDAVRAAMILKAHAEGEYEAALAHEFPDIDVDRCPACGSGEFTSTLAWDMLLLVLCTMGLFGIIFPITRDHRRCVACGNKWKR